MKARRVASRLAIAAGLVVAGGVVQAVAAAQADSFPSCTRTVSADFTGSIVMSGAGNTLCVGPGTGGNAVAGVTTFTGSIALTNGASLMVDTARISGSITGNSPASVRVTNSQTGSITVNHATQSVEINFVGGYSNLIHGNVTVANSPATVVIYGNNFRSSNAFPFGIEGNVVVANNTNSVLVSNNDIQNSLTVANNLVGPVTVTFNNYGGALQLASNAGLTANDNNHV